MQIGLEEKDLGVEGIPQVLRLQRPNDKVDLHDIPDLLVQQDSAMIIPQTPWSKLGQ